MSEPLPGQDSTAGDPASGGSVAAGSSDAPPEFLEIAQIQAPHGVGGEVRARVLTDFPRRFARLKTVYLGEEADPVRLQRSRPAGAEIILKLAGVDTPEAAAKLRFKVVRVRASEAVALPAGAYFHYQIIGLQAVTVEGEVLGNVTDILTTGANDVYVVAGEAGEYLIPAIADVVLEIDPAGHRMAVRLMEGMEPRPLRAKAPRPPRPRARNKRPVAAEPSVPSAPAEIGTAAEPSAPGPAAT